MPTNLNAEQILALAPDPGAAQAGRKLANPRNWQNLGQNNAAVWGECQGSGKDPYRVQIDLTNLAFRCSCPSRKFPCKHGLGLLLMLAAQPNLLTIAEAPPWVSEWLLKRSQTEAKRKEPAAAADTTTTVPRSSSRSKASANREAKVAAGIEELERWLLDQMRGGLATMQSRPLSAWDAIAARMVDAQAPGLARRIRDLAGVAVSGAGWQSRMLDRLARLYLLVEGYQRREVLPPDLLIELRTQIGWPQDQEALRNRPGIRDEWMVLGQRTIEEDGLRTQRTWVWGRSTNRPALLLAFAAGGQPLDRSVIPGTRIDAELVYFEGSFILRALIKERYPLTESVTSMPGHPTLREGLAAYATGLTQNPWLEQFPLCIRAVVPEYHNQAWHVRDNEGRILPVIATEQHSWRLAAISGGNPIDICGEWDGEQFVLLSACAEERFVRLS